MSQPHSHSHSHSHDGITHSHHEHPHSHTDHHHEHGHTHEILENPGSFLLRSQPLKGRNWKERGGHLYLILAFTVGLGGPVGSGKTALLLALCQRLYPKFNIAAVTNDIFTQEDAEFLIKNEALPAGVCDIFDMF